METLQREKASCDKRCASVGKGFDVDTYLGIVSKGCFEFILYFGGYVVCLHYGVGSLYKDMTVDYLTLSVASGFEFVHAFHSLG